MWISLLFSGSCLVLVNWYTIFMRGKNNVVIIREMFGATIQNLFDPTVRRRRLTHPWLKCTMILILNAIYRPTYFRDLMFYEQNHFLCPSKKINEILKRIVSVLFSTATREFFTVCDYTNLADQFSLNMEIALHCCTVHQ